jgi:hypothetical protein
MFENRFLVSPGLGWGGWFPLPIQGASYLLQVLSPTRPALAKDEECTLSSEYTFHVLFLLILFREF